jgi:alkylhydroperoxidase/carboxymuconolactone decarboxylase family protein YurZ
MQIKLAWMEDLRKIDADLADKVGEHMASVMAPGALDVKTKALIALSNAAAHGRRIGVANIARLARSVGATDQELLEAVKIAWISAGDTGLVTGLVAFAKQSKDEG